MYISRDKMIRSFSAINYRGFQNFTLDNLSQVNLLVGTNNSGKTSLLEAISLLCAGANVSSMAQILGRRGERYSGSDEIEVRHLFYNHEMSSGASFHLEARTRFSKIGSDYKIIDNFEERLFSREPSLEAPDVALEINQFPNGHKILVPLTSSGAFTSRAANYIARSGPATEPQIECQFVFTESLSILKLQQLWNSILLTEAEELVISALRLLDDSIERVAAISGERIPTSRNRGGFLVLTRNSREPIPIGSFGDGIWRVLAVAISLIRARDGILLIDEIDTGLHYSVMEDMWRLIVRTAIDLNVQVFATTHSLDCLTSLGKIANPNADYISLQRIEKGRGHSISFSEGEIRAAVERDIEVR